MQTSMSDKFDKFQALFEPRSVEMALGHFLHKPVDKKYTLSVSGDSQKLEFIFPDGSTFTKIEKVKKG